MTRALFLFGLPAQRGGVWQDPSLAARVSVKDQYELDAELLKAHSAIVLTMHNDQRHLASRQGLLEDFVRGGGTLVAQGQIAEPFLSVLTPYVPLHRPRLDQMAVRRIQPHPVFDGFDPATMNVREGVRGFYGRGHNPPPNGAEVLQTIADGVPLDWVLVWGKGRILMHGGNDLWSTYADAAQNTRLTLQLLNWCLDG